MVEADYLISPPAMVRKLYLGVVLAQTLCYTAGSRAAPSPDEAAPTQLPALKIEAPRSLADWLPAGSGSLIGAVDIDRVRATHPSELLFRSPGTWVSRGDGQEHLTAIRSPVLTGPGACGAFLFLEDGIPIDAAGFCNVNDLFQINTEQAAGIEVTRGPAAAQFGANALHGAINVLTPLPVANLSRFGLDLGADDTAATRLSWGTEVWRADLYSVDTNGFRDAAGHGQQKLNLAQRLQVADWQVTNRLAATNLNQETAGFITGKNAYRKAGLRRDNQNPEAFRDAWSSRASSVWQKPLGDSALLSLTPYARGSSMTFLQHFLPGAPLEENSQHSLGMILDLQLALDRGGQWSWGANLERAVGDLREVQASPVTSGSAFLRATRPAGVHYDYRVQSLLAAAWYQVQLPLGERWELLHDLRAEHMSYEYNNQSLTGNSKDNGTPCGFGGCLFNRPADRVDIFNNLGARLGLAYRLGADRIYAAGSLGFRPPQATELYRLQRGQSTADLDSEQLTAVELGWRRRVADLSWSLAGFAMRKRHFIFRDAEGFNVSNGRTNHWGLEAELDWRLSERHRLNLNATAARHRYAFSRNLGGGEVVHSGDEIDTAPPVLASARWEYRPTPPLGIELEGIRMGPYYLDASNTARYEGHTLWHLRTSWRTGAHLTLAARITNLTGIDYAERADLAFGEFRYFPGTPRRLFLGFDYSG